MAALSITATNVVPVFDSNYRAETKKALTALTAGQSAYYDPQQDGFGAFDADSASAYVNRLAGIVIGPGVAAGQPVTVQKAGIVALGAVLTKGQAYIGGATAGAIHPIADVTTGWRIQILGLAISTTQLRLINFDTEITV